MTLYRVTPEKLEPVTATTFEEENVLERGDLQRMLLHDVSPLGDDLMVLAEEFGDWEDSNRRIDLLCLTREAGLAVVELKRTQDGGHMELQAIRYAAMVSSMTMEQAVAACARTNQWTIDRARAEVHEFIQAEAADAPELSGEVRIILVSSDFSAEITTAVLWLNRHDLDITCIRMRPYRSEGRVLIDVTQTIPLPEAADYEIKLRAQDKEKRRSLSSRQETLRKFWTQFIEEAQRSTSLLGGRSTTTAYWLSTGLGRAGFNLNATLTSDSSAVECYINTAAGRASNVTAFEQLRRRSGEIESVVGVPLDWQILEGRKSCRICVHLPGGWASPEAEWPENQRRMLDMMVKFEQAFRTPIQDLDL